MYTEHLFFAEYTEYIYFITEGNVCKKSKYIFPVNLPSPLFGIGLK